MNLSTHAVRMITAARRPAIIPFAAGMYGGEFPPEECNRLDTLIEFWYHVRAYQPLNITRVLCGGGLQNRYGLSLARSMADYLISRVPGLQDSISIVEEESTHTAHQIRLMRDFILTSQFDLIMPISNWWHLRRIARFFRYYYEGVPLLPIASPAYGTMSHRLFRAIQESAFYAMSLSVDRDGKQFDSVIEKRKAAAAARP